VGEPFPNLRGGYVTKSVRIALALLLTTLPVFTCGVGPLFREILERLDEAEMRLAELEVASVRGMPALFDANGDEFGVLTRWSGGNPAVVVEIDGLVYEIHFDNVTGLVRTEDHGFYFQDPGCSGTPYYGHREPGPFGILTPGDYTITNGLFWIGDPSYDHTQSVELPWYQRRPSDPCRSSGWGSEPRVGYKPQVPVLDFEAEFPPPYELRF